ncbi:TraG family conjugative transposon ATPase [Parabacteroides distasonis]|uniref:TraG family conjugative transposon ATPase n=1 Tax=Parabacteroides distasonis TaxID=823 RepID=UPI001C00B7F6|nr:TraG family conjugative transposon ATPase [Parabacteroides distasonis]MBT9679243.1 TraG family conjugative transposon ATPase [Parabacteroides distasonis]
MSWFLLNRNLTPLEPYDWKLSRTVLRGERGSNAPDLPGKAIASANMAGYIRYLYKTVRKFFGEAVVVTQEVDDIISSPVVKESIINNSDCKILLDQRKYMNKFDQIQALLGLTDKERGQILSINQSNDATRSYKEVWIGLGGVQSAVYATEVSKAEYLTYTTEETEKMRVLARAKQLGGNMELAVRLLAEEA